jgi:hypothetical protein
VKGLETPVPVYELTGVVPARSRLQATATRGLSRFVGRESEMQQLAQVLERAARGHGQTVAVVGEPGVGKSRLVWEFIRSHHTHGWLVLESGSVSYGKATPYLPVIELLKAYCRIQERDDPRAIRERPSRSAISRSPLRPTRISASRNLIAGDFGQAEACFRRLVQVLRHSRRRACCRRICAASWSRWPGSGTCGASSAPVGLTGSVRGARDP